MKPTATDIDQLYGLEPVLELDNGAGSDALEQFQEVGCPYCAEQLLVRLDLSAGSQTYVEDCQVCCQPIELAMTIAEDGSLAALNAARMDF